MSSFESIGVRAQMSTVRETIEIGGIRNTKEFAITTLMLPTRPKVQASFSREGIGKKIIKLFKKEIQVGDKTFDDIVYVATDTPAETAEFLKQQDIQTTILLAVTEGGSIEIDGQKVVTKIPFGGAGEDPAVFRFVQALLA